MAARIQTKSVITIARHYWLLIVAVSTSSLSDAQSFEREWKLGFTGKAKWSESCDFSGGDYNIMYGNWQEGKCEELCVADKRCTHFTSKKIACFLKTFEQPFVMEKSVGFLDLGATCGFAINRVNEIRLLDGNSKSSFEWRIGAGRGNYKWGTGCNFILGSDIDNIAMGSGANCGDTCFANKRCTHFNYYRNRCFLKTIIDLDLEASVYNSPDGICGFIVERKLTKQWQSSNNGRINWGVKCDFPGGINLETTELSLSENKLKCGEKCLANKRCTHFAYYMQWPWQNSCHLKEFQGEKGAVEIYKEDAPICGFIVPISAKSVSNTKPKITAPASLLVSSEKENKQLQIVSPKKDQSPILWSDQFSDVELNRNKNWKHVVDVSKTGFQYYTSNKENSFIRDGMLNIQPTLTSDRFGGNDFLEKGCLDLIKEGCDPKSRKCTVDANQSADIINPVSSAKLITKDSFNFTFGTVQIRAKMPKGDWISTVISLEPAGNVYGKGYLSGTIELLRVRGNLHMSCMGSLYNRRVVSSGLIWGPIDSIDSITDASTIYKLNEGFDFSTDFHVFSTKWSPECVTFFVDGKLVGQLQAPEGGLWKYAVGDATTQNNPWISGSRMAPFDQPFFISVRVDVGGQNFPDINCTYLPKRKPWSSSNPNPMRRFWDDIDHWFPTWKAAKGENTLQIDYIRVYSLPD